MTSSVSLPAGHRTSRRPSHAYPYGPSIDHRWYHTQERRPGHAVGSPGPRQQRRVAVHRTALRRRYLDRQMETTHGRRHDHLVGGYLPHAEEIVVRSGIRRVLHLCHTLPVRGRLLLETAGTAFAYSLPIASHICRALLSPSVFSLASERPPVFVRMGLDDRCMFSLSVRGSAGVWHAASSRLVSPSSHSLDSHSFSSPLHPSNHLQLQHDMVRPFMYLIPLTPSPSFALSPPLFFLAAS